MLSYRNVQAGYGGLPVLRDVSFTVQEGEAVAIFGHNGAGKTTLLKCSIGDIPGMQGSVTYRDAPIVPGGVFLNVRRGIGFVPQGHNVFRHLSVRQNLAIAGLKHGGDALQECIEFVSDPRAARRADSRLAVRRAAADSGAGHGTDDQAVDPVVGRTFNRIGTSHCARCDGEPRRGQSAVQHDDRGGGA